VVVGSFAAVSFLYTSGYLPEFPDLSTAHDTINGAISTALGATSDAISTAVNATSDAVEGFLDATGINDTQSCLPPVDQNTVATGLRQMMGLKTPPPCSWMTNAWSSICEWGSKLF